MGHHAALAGVQHRVVLVEAAGDVVGRRDRRQRGVAQAIPAHHSDISPRDRQDRRRTVRCRGHRVALRQFLGQRVARQERSQVRADRHRAYARAAAAVRDAERLVQVQVADIAAELARPSQPHQSVEVGAVDVNLSACIVHRRADVGDVVFVHPMRGRVSDHQRGQLVGVLGHLGAQVVQVDVAVLPACHHDHPHADHGGRRGVGAVCARRDQADIAGAVAAPHVVVADGQQARVLTLRSGVGLQRDCVVTGQTGQPGLQVGDQLAQARGVAGRGERMLAAELGPGDRLHLGGRVELHRAGPQRNHAAIQRDVLVGQHAQIAHHLGLGAVPMERRVGEEFACPRIDLGSHVVTCHGCAEGFQDQCDVRGGGGLIAGDRHVVGVDPPDVDTAALGLGLHRGGPVRDVGEHGVEEAVVHHIDARRTQAGGQRAGVTMDPPGDPGQALRTVVAGVHRRHDREQHLRGTDVGCRLVAADVLFAGLQRQPVRRCAISVHRHPDQPAGQLAGMLGVHCQETGVRTTESHWHTESLGTAERHVGPELPRRSDQRQRQQVGAQRHQRAAFVGRLDQL